MLNGAKVGIRPVRSADLPFLYEKMNDLESIGDYLPSVFKSYPELVSEYEQSGFLSESLSRLLVVDETGEVIGLTWFFTSVPYFDALEVGYRIFDVSHRRKGYASEALGLLCKYIFEGFRVNRIEIRVATENTSSKKVAIKCGFELEGTHRQAAFSKGSLHDMYSFALLRDDWASGI